MFPTVDSSAKQGIRSLPLDRPGEEFQRIARSVELIGYTRLFSWTCLVVFISAGVPTLMFDPAGSFYSTTLVWLNRCTAGLAAVFGLFGLWRLSTGRNLHSQSPELWLGGSLLFCLAFNNAFLLVDTNESRHAGAAILTMICTAIVYPRWIGILVVSLPQVGVALWLAQKHSWAPNWLFAFSATFGGAFVAVLSFYGRRVYTLRHQALLAERASMIKALQTQSVEHAVVQERALNTRYLSTLGRLAGGIAHDLNNILVPILGNAAMLEESLQTSTHQQQAKEIMVAAGRARNLTKQLGYFAARDDEAQETLELNSTLAELAPIVWRALPQGIDILIKDNPHPVYLTLNRMKLQDLVTNLLLEAGNATLPGKSVSLKVFHEARLPAGFLADKNTNYCAIAIRDGAETLTNDEQIQLFDSANLNIGERTRGLGLRSARASAELLGGTLTVQSAESGGNQFCLFLPQRPRGNTDTQVPDQRISSGVATEVLVVDDEPAVRNVTAQLLKRAGFIVRSCESGETALTEIAGHLPDVIVMDLRMPGIGGRAAAESIRSNYARLPIVICTGYAGDAKGWLEQLPNCALLQKPYETAELIGAVKRLLQPEGAAG